MEIRKNKNSLEYLLLIFPIIGLLGISILLFKIKRVLALNINNLPLKIEQLPSEYLFWIFTGFLIIPFVFLRANKKIRIASLIITLIFVGWSFVIFSPYGYPYGRDSQYAYQTAEIMEKAGYWNIDTGTGFAVTYSKYPAMYLFNIISSKLSYIPLIYSFMFMQSLLRLILIPLIVYLIFRKIFDFDISILCVFLYFSCFTLINWPHHENFAIIFFFFFLYSYLLNLEKSTIFTKILTILSALFVFMSHHFTSYLLLLWVFLFPFSSFIWNFSKRRDIGNSSEIKKYHFKSSLIMFVILFILFFLWASSFSLQQNINQGKWFINYFSKSVKTDITNIITESIQIEDANLSLDINISSLNDTELKNLMSYLNSEKSLNVSKKLDINNFLSSKYKQIQNFMKTVPGANFTEYQLIIISLSLIILFILVIYGIINWKSFITYIFLLNNLLFSFLIILISIILFFTPMNYVLLRIFEFSYIGIIPLIAYSIVSLNKKYRVARFIFPAILIIILLGGLMSIRLTTIRNYYVHENKIVIDNFIFALPSFIKAALWFKQDFAYTKLLGDNLIYDTIGAFGYGDLRRYELGLLNNFYNSKKISEINYEKAIKKDIFIITTHKYSAYSNYKGDKNKFENEDRLDMIYNNQNLQFFQIN